MGVGDDLPEQLSPEDEHELVRSALEPMLEGGVKAAEVAQFVCDSLGAPEPGDEDAQGLYELICFYAAEAVGCSGAARAAMARLREALTPADVADAVVEVSIQASNAGLALSKVVKLARLGPEEGS